MKLLVLVTGCSLGCVQPSGGLGNDGGARDAGLDADVGNTADAGEGLDAGDGWRSLFNGRDFSGWRRYLGKPSNAEPPLGFDNDPRGVFSIRQVDGEPVIHVSGEVWGSLVSDESFSAFELTVEYRWGTRDFPPLNFKDSGLMYLTTGPAGAVNAGGDALSNPMGSGAFFVSMEYQLAPGDTGTVYNLGPIRHQASPRQNVPERDGWNEVRIVLENGQVRHFLNGAEVAHSTGFTLAWPGQPVTPLTTGTLQLQSEGAEIDFRRLRLRPR